MSFQEISHPLHGASPDRAIAAAYYALRLLRHRRKVANWSNGIFVDALASEPSAIERSLGQLIIQEIEASEGATMSAFDEVTVQKYIAALGRMIEDSAFVAYGSESSLGRKLLKELRDMQ